MKKAHYRMAWTPWLLLVVLAGGCSTLTSSSGGKGSSPKAILVAPAIPEHWRMSGRIGVTQGADGWHGKLNWTQKKEDFNIQILGPFGGEQAELRHANSRLDLRAPNGKSISGAKLAKWEKEMFGTSLPVKALPYWLHGVPYPNMNEKVTRDGKGRTKMISQSGWRVEYNNWAKRGNAMMPGKVTLYKRDVRIKLIVNEYNRRV